MSSPLITIISPVYNQEDFIEETIKSVVQQEYVNWEFILVDDGSTDCTLDKIEMFLSDNRIKLVPRQRAPKGAATCRNIGLEHATGEYIIFLDSDDLLDSACLKQRVNIIKENQHLDYWVFPMLLFKEKVDDLMILQNIRTDENDLDRFLKRENVWLISCPIWRKHVLVELGGFDENCLSYQDWELNVKALVNNYKYKFFDDLKPDNYYRQVVANNISSKRFSPPHLLSQKALLVKILNLLKEKDKLSIQRKVYLSKFIFANADSWRYTSLAYPEVYKNAKEVWSISRKNKLINPYTYYIAGFYILYHQWTFLWKFAFIPNILEWCYNKLLLKKYLKPYKKIQNTIIYTGL